MLGRPQSQSGHSGEEDNSLPMLESNPSCPACSLVTILNELSWLPNCAHILFFTLKTHNFIWALNEFINARKLHNTAICRICGTIISTIHSMQTVPYRTVKRLKLLPDTLRKKVIKHTKINTPHYITSSKYTSQEVALLPLCVNPLS
jgi:hypothetical protein